MQENREGKIDGPLERHIEIHLAVTEINSVVQHLDELINKINGPTTAEAHTGMNKEEEPTLSYVLNEAPSEIRRKIDELHKRVDEIQNLIF